MPIIFPQNPTFSQVYTNPTSGDSWKWNGYAWETLGNVNPIGPQGQTGETGATGPQGPTGPAGTGGNPFYYQDTTPSGSITPGSFWYDSDLGNLYVYVDDGDSEQWVTPVSQIGPTGPSGATGSDASILMAYKKYDVSSDLITTVSRVSFLPINATDTTGNFSTTKIYPIIIQKPVTIEAVWHRVNVGGVGRTLTVALYTNYQTYIPRPDSLIFQIPTDFDMSVTGAQEVFLTSPVTLQPDIYWVACSTNGGNVNTALSQGYNHWGVLGYQDINGNSGAILAPLPQGTLFDNANPFPSTWNINVRQNPTDGGAIPAIKFRLI